MSGALYILDISLVTGTNATGSGNYSILQFYGSMKRQPNKNTGNPDTLLEIDVW